jgi:hypothetical protein
MAEPTDTAPEHPDERRPPSWRDTWRDRKAKRRRQRGGPVREKISARHTAPSDGKSSPVARTRELVGAFGRASLLVAPWHPRAEYPGYIMVIRGIVGMDVSDQTIRDWCSGKTEVPGFVDTGQLGAEACRRRTTWRKRWPPTRPI